MNLELGTHKAADILNYKAPKHNKAGKFDSLKAWLYRFTYKSLVTVIMVGAGALLFLIGQAYNEYTRLNTVSVAFADTKVVEAPIAILTRIADCESGNGQPGTATQFKNGQVLISINTNGTYDQGMYQINSIHNKQAAILGDDLATQEGNAAYAKYLFLTHGSGDWQSSAHCWSR